MPNPTSNIRPRPDSTSAFVGDTGDIIVQDDDGTILTRKFPGEDQDWSFSAQDITNDSVVANPADVGATSEVSGAIRSLDEKAFSVTINWQDGLGNTLYAESPPALQNVDSTDDYEAVIESVTTKSATAEVVVTDESGTVSHEITGTINFH